MTNSKYKNGPHLVVPGDGDPCPRCRRPMQIREHRRITARHRRQPFHYRRWFCCMHDDCKTTTVMLPRYRVWHCSGQKRRYLKARFLGKGLTRERAKEVAEAKERGEVVWGDTWPDDDDAAATLHSNVPDKTDMSIEGPKLSPGKGGWPKSKRKQALRRYRLSAAAEHKRAMERRLFGTQGAASPVRRIDPATGEIIEVIKKKASPASPGKALITTSHRRRDPDESL